MEKCKHLEVRKLFRKFFLLVIVGIFSLQMNGQTITSNVTGTHNGWFYSFWTENQNNGASMTLGPDGNYSTKWNNTLNFTAGKGWNPGKKDRVVCFEGTYDGGSNGFLALYGWTKNPLIEYYVCEKHGQWEPPGNTSGVEYKGTYTCDGGTYKMYTGWRENKPSIIGTASFQQFWSVRVEQRSSGTITFAKHVEAWETMGNMKLGTTWDYQIMESEGYNSSGSSNITVRECQLSPISVAITAPTATTVFTAPATVNITATATTTSGSISKVEFYNGTTKLGEDASSPYSYSWTNVAAGSYKITAVATDNSGTKLTSSEVVVKVNIPQGPYLGTAWPIPGKIEFENYDVGGNGSAYLDNSAGTSVSPAPNFRTDEDVDIENCTDVGAGYNIGYSTAGEWLEYTVNVAATGKYNLVLRVAASGTGRTISIATESGTTIASNLAIPNTGGWQTWVDLPVNDISLTAGTQVIRVTIGATDYVNLNYMTFTTTSTAPPTVVTPVTYCQGATATALTATGTALKWYTTATGGTASTTAPVPSTTATGSTTYYVSQTLNSLESERAAIVVTVNASPATPTVTTPVNYTVGDVATALTASGTALKWYNVATGGNALASAPVPSTASAATTKYYVSQTVSTCESSRAEIIVVVTPAVVPTVTLKTGWNLIGCPIDGSTDIAKALSSVWSQVESVKNADSYWQASNTIPGLNTLIKLNWGEGYLIKVKANCELDWIVR